MEIVEIISDLILVSIIAFIATILIMYIKYKKLDVTGTFVKSGDDFKILMDTSRDIKTFQRTVDHEVIHSLKHMGKIKRDVPTATIIEYISLWEKGELSANDDYIKSFNEGRKAVKNSEDIGGRIDYFLKEYDKIDYEPADSYGIGAFIAGVAIELSNEDSDSAFAYSKAIAQGYFHSEAEKQLQKTLSSKKM